MMILLKVALMCAWPTASTLTTLFLALSFLLSAVAIIEKFILYLLTFSCLLLVGDGFTLSFARTGIVLRCLTTHRKTLAMTQTTIASNIHKTLDAELNLRFQHTHDPVFLSNDSPNGVGFVVAPVFNLFIPAYVGLVEDVLGRAAPDAKNIREANLAPFIVRNIYTSDTCHIC